MKVKTLKICKNIRKLMHYKLLTHTKTEKKFDFRDFKIIVNRLKCILS